MQDRETLSRIAVAELAARPLIDDLAAHKIAVYRQRRLPGKRILTAWSKPSPAWHTSVGTSTASLRPRTRQAGSRTQVVDAGMQAKVFFHGPYDHRRDLQGILAGCHFFVYPSRYEGGPCFSLSRSCKRARFCVASRLGGVPDLYEADRESAHSAPNDELSLRANLENTGEQSAALIEGEPIPSEFADLTWTPPTVPGSVRSRWTVPAIETTRILRNALRLLPRPRLACDYLEFLWSRRSLAVMSSAFCLKGWIGGLSGFSEFHSCANFVNAAERRFLRDFLSTVGRSWTSVPI